MKLNAKSQIWVAIFFCIKYLALTIGVFPVFMLHMGVWEKFNTLNTSYNYMLLSSKVRVSDARLMLYSSSKCVLVDCNWFPPTPYNSSSDQCCADCDCSSHDELNICINNIMSSENLCTFDVTFVIQIWWAQAYSELMK